MKQNAIRKTDIFSSCNMAETDKGSDKNNDVKKRESIRKKTDKWNKERIKQGHERRIEGKKKRERAKTKP